MDSESLLAALESVCTDCPKKAYIDTCPFRILSGISETSRVKLFGHMTIKDIYALFDLAKGCACPKDPRRQASEPDEESARVD